MVQIEDSKFDIKINSFFFKELKEADEHGILNKEPKEDNLDNEENLNEDNNNDDEDESINNNNNYNYNNDHKKYGYNNKQNYNEEDDDNNNEKDLID